MAAPTGEWNTDCGLVEIKRLRVRTMHSRSIIKYFWVSPVTGLALLLVLMCLATGGRAALVWGVIEVQGGVLTRILRRGNRWIGPISAITLGHVIIGQNQECLDVSRFHEHVHVRQFERWGPFMGPLYLAASVWCWLRGRDPYLDNPFEVEAYAADEARSRL